MTAAFARPKTSLEATPRPGRRRAITTLLYLLFLCSTVVVSCVALRAGDDNDRFFSGAVVEEPTGYRVGRYRGATPATIRGGKVVNNTQAMQLWKTKQALFIDVLPRADRPKNLPKGTIWRDKKRRNIPGSIWLVNVGFGKLNPQLEAYFQTNLKKATAGDKTKPVLFYCLKQCWMSWNAAKRAIEWGYKNVYWYRDGTDGWKKIGGKLALQEPVPRANRAR